MTLIHRDSALTENYTYDEVGNRLTSTDVASYSYNSSNQLTAADASSFTYDHNGNTTTKTDTNGQTTYAWDYENRLTSVALPNGGGVVSFKYDPFGRRIQKSSGSGTTIYVYDGANGVEEVNASGAVVARYVQGAGIDEPLAQSRSGLSYYNADGLGSITSLTDSSGAPTATFVYGAFGVLNSSTGTTANSYRYTAREYDEETGLYYYRARYYDSSTGRFVNEDPIGFFAGNNFFQYVSDNPANYKDSSGLKEYPDGFIGPLRPNDYYTSQMTATACGKVPPHPSWADLNVNIAEAKKHWNPLWFRNKVRNNKDHHLSAFDSWDYKQLNPLYEDFGNFNYGATGYEFGFNPEFLLREAGRASLAADPKNRAGWPGDPGNWNPSTWKAPYKDDADDQVQIQRGVDYCKCMRQRSR